MVCLALILHQVQQFPLGLGCPATNRRQLNAGVLTVAHFDEITAGYTFGLVAQGWLACTCGWALLAVSFWATLKAIPYADPLENLATMFPVLLASVALATVLGFVSLLPGGVGVREWALNQLMVPQIGEVAALAGAIVLRLVWLLTELLISVILYFGLRSAAQDANPSVD